METLNIQTRESSEDLTKMRESGDVPAVLYGPKQESISIKLKQTDFIKLYKQVGESAIISLNLDDGKEEHESLIHDLSIDPVKNTVEHVDFYVIERGKELTVNVPIEFIGIAPAEKDFNGVLVKVLHEVPIKARPKDLPQKIEVSLESLEELSSQINLKDIVLPEGVTLDADPEEAVVVMQEAKEEPEEEVETPDMDSIEVVGEKTGEEEGEEGESKGGEESSE